MSIFSGISQLIQSPSGVFSLLSLMVLSILTWHDPSMGSAAWVAFFGVVPSALGYFEHKETLAQMTQQSNVTAVISQNTITTESKLPDRGKL